MSKIIQKTQKEHKKYIKTFLCSLCDKKQFLWRLSLFLGNISHGLVIWLNLMKCEKLTRSFNLR